MAMAKCHFTLSNRQAESFLGVFRNKDLMTFTYFTPLQYTLLYLEKHIPIDTSVMILTLFHEAVSLL